MRGKLLRTLLGIVIALGVAVGVLWLQFRADVSRERAGLAIVHEYRSPRRDRSFDSLLQGWHAGNEVRWTARTESGCADQVRVTGAIWPFSTYEPSHLYEFLVDVNTHQIAPGNEYGRRAIEALAAPSASPAPSTSASASSSTTTTPPASASR